MNEQEIDLGYFDFMKLTDLLKEIFDDSASEKAIVGYYLDLANGNISKAY